MVKTSILLADNDVDFLETRREFLEREGFSVKSAFDLTEAQHILEQAGVDLAILDLRLLNDDDDKDVSGLGLAKQAAPATPKIILTRYPSYEHVREVLGPVLDGLPPAVGFLAKQEGPKAMLAAVKKAVDHYVQINYQLEVIFAELQSFQSMARQIVSRDLSKEELNARANELAKLIRHLFYENTEVILDKVIMYRPGQVVARVKARSDKEEKPQYLLKCETSELARREKDVYERRHAFLQRWALQCEDIAESIHFGVIVYGAPTGLELESAQWLADYYRLHTVGNICHALKDLFGKAYETLYTQPYSRAEDKSLDLLYKEYLDLPRHEEAAFREAVREVAIHAQLQHLLKVNLEPETGAITFLFPDGNAVSYPDPTGYIYREVPLLGPPISRQLALGSMDGYNIVVDRENRAWMTDFAAVGLAPAWSDFVALEATIRFEWIDTTDVRQLYDFELQLTSLKSLEKTLETLDNSGSDVQKALKTITCLRQLAARIPGVDPGEPLEYLIGMLFHTARLILAGISPDRRLHALLAAAMICKTLEDQIAEVG